MAATSATAMKSATTTNDDDVDQHIVVFVFDFLHSICIKLNTRLFGLPLKCNANLISYINESVRDAVTCVQLDRRSSCESRAGINYVHIFCFIHDLFICNFSTMFGKTEICSHKHKRTQWAVYLPMPNGFDIIGVFYFTNR